MIDTKLAFEHHFFDVLGAHEDTLCTRAHRSGSLLWENGRLLELMAMVSPSRYPMDHRGGSYLTSVGNGNGDTAWTG
jgi:hypothetical protein